jgi:hypothetical protein
MSLSQIQQINEEIAAEAAAERREPWVPWPQDIERWQEQVRHGIAPRIPFPNLGTYEPEGWELLEQFFVDSTGWDLHDAGGPAMSVAEFIDALEPGYGYAIVEQGPFQVYIGKFQEV